MLRFLGVLVVAFIIMGVLGFVVKGLFWLFVLACVLFAVDLLIGVLHLNGRWARRRTVMRR